MPDMLVNLLKLAPLEPVLDALKESGVIIRRAQPHEMTPVRDFVLANFETSWADEISVGYSNKPVSVLLAIRDRRVIGFAAYECTRRSFFGPTGVIKAERGSANHFAQRKTPLTPEEIAGLRKDLKDMLANPECGDFAKALFNQLGNSYSDDALTLFDKVGEQGGFYKIPSYPPWGEAPDTIGGGNASIGIILAAGNAAVFHNGVAQTLFHELVHVSSNSRISVGHPEMAQAAYAVAIAQGKNVPKPPEPGSKDYDYQSSVYFGLDSLMLVN